MLDQKLSGGKKGKEKEKERGREKNKAQARHDNIQLSSIYSRSYGRRRSLEPRSSKPPGTTLKTKQNISYTPITNEVGRFFSTYRYTNWESRYKNTATSSYTAKSSGLPYK